MRALHGVLALASALSFLCGCDGTSTEPAGAHRTRKTAALGLPAGLSPLPTPTVRHRYVALMPIDVGCPTVDGWTGRPLFRLTAPARAAWDTLADLDTEMPPVLARFCVYMAQSPTPTAAPTVPGAVRVDPDFSIVSPQAPSMSVPQARAEEWLSQVGATPNTATATGPTPYSGDPDGLPYVAIVDTADSTPPGVAAGSSIPSGWAFRHQHGLSMAALIDATRCPLGEPTCLARQFRAQAFPFAGSDTLPDPVASGGQWASLGSLASAVGESLAGWRTRPDAEHAPLVLNLSVGWDPIHGTVTAGHESLLDPTSPDPSVPATVQAVHSALAWASCQGVVTVAAAGNARGGDCSETGALAPASWESLPPVSASTCASIAGPWALADDAVPLAYGVGGITTSGDPIANARPGSLPARVLYAHQGAAPSGGGYTEAWTGTSVATAAMSALVATVASHTSEIEVETIVSAIDATGTPLAVDSGWLQDEVGETRRLSFDEALGDALGWSGPYASTGGGHVEASVIQALASQPMPTPSANVVQLSAGASAATCSGLTVTPATATGSEPIPPANAETDELRPQPHVPICPTCPVANQKRITGSSTGSPSTAPDFALYIDVDPSYDPTKISQATLAFSDRSTATGLQLSLPPSNLGMATSTVNLTNVRLPDGTSVSDWLDGHPGVSEGRIDFAIDLGRGPQPIRQVIDVIH